MLKVMEGPHYYMKELCKELHGWKDSYLQSKPTRTVRYSLCFSIQAFSLIEVLKYCWPL